MAITALTGELPISNVGI